MGFSETSSCLNVHLIRHVDRFEPYPHHIKGKWASFRIASYVPQASPTANEEACGFLTPQAAQRSNAPRLYLKQAKPVQFGMGKAMQ